MYLLLCLLKCVGLGQVHEVLLADQIMKGLLSCSPFGDPSSGHGAPLHHPIFSLSVALFREHTISVCI